MRSHRRRPAPFSYSVALRVEALLILLTVQVGLATVQASNARHPEQIAAASASNVVAAPTPSPQPNRPTQPVVVKPQPTAQATKPAVRPATPHAARDSRTQRWIPSGTGMWTYQWSRTEGGDTRAVVRRAQELHLSHIFVRTGTRKGGFDGGRVLSQLLPATRGTNIKVVAWDFPILADPVADARRLARAAHFRVKGAPRVAAVAPDIETAAEGTRLSGPAVDKYLRTLRALLPNDVAILTCVPWPSEKRLGRYPYDTVGKLSDGIIPMAYWINRDPGTVAAQTMLRLKKYGKPVMPVGQAYDPRIDVPTLKLGPPSEADVNEFVRVSRRYGAPAVSLWVWQFAHPVHWKAIERARHQFPAAAS